MRLLTLLSALAASGLFVGDVAHGAVTLPAGNSPPSSFNTEQPSLGLNYVIRLNGTFDELGEVALFGGNFAPRGWAFAHGQNLQVSPLNAALFSKIGTTFGGDGINTFRLPDLRGRTPIGAGQGNGLPEYTLGQEVGQQQVTLSDAPVHSHDLGGGWQTSDAGANAAHSNMQPSIALTPVIALQGVFPSRNALPAEGDLPSGIGVSGAEPFLGEMAWLASDDVPQGWTVADGDLLQISQHQALFALLGTTYGGDGRSTFALPDLRGRAATGFGQSPGRSTRPIGARFGVTEETLTADQTPHHDHEIEAGGHTAAEGGASQSNVQPSIAINYSVPLAGVFPSRNAPIADGIAQIGGSTDPFLASLSMFAFNFAPRGFAHAEGQLLPIVSNQATFSLLGTIYGGDGRTTFALPDLQGRVPVGAGAGTGLANRSLGQRFGFETSVLNESHLPMHTHTFSIPGDYNDDGLVDAADYTVWRDHLGQDVALPNDPIGQPVGPAHYEQWRANYGLPSTASPAPALAVPAPAGVTLLVLAGSLACGALRH